MSEKISLPIVVNFEAINEQSDLRKCNIKICKEGLVPSHKLYITQKAIEDAIETIFYKPLLCSYVTDSEGNKVEFKGHDIEYKQEGNSFKRVYIEQPIGVIPKECDYSFDEDNYLCVNAYIFNKYCEEVIKIIENDNNEKDVSMETEILETTYNETEDVTYVDKFKFTGITFLDGYKHQASIDGCKVQLFENNNFMQDFEKLIERVNKLELEKGGVDLNKKEIIEKYSALKNHENFEKIISNDSLSDDELEKELFSLSSNDLYSRISEELSKNKVIVKDYWGDTYESNKYWLSDVLYEEQVIIVEDNQDYYKHYGIPYTLKGDSAVLNYEGIKRYIRDSWKPFDDGSEDIVNPMFEVIKEKVDIKIQSEKEEFEKVKSELDDAKAKFTDLESTKVELEKKVEELELVNKQFEEAKAKAEKDAKELELDSIVEEFSELASFKGFNELVEKRFEMTSDELSTKLKVFAYDNGKVITKGKKEENFSKPNNFIKTSSENKDPEKLTEAQKRYGEDIIKYI